MKALFVAITLLTSLASSAQTVPSPAPQKAPAAAPIQVAPGAAPAAEQGAASPQGFRGETRGDWRGDEGDRGGDRDRRRRGTQVVVTREELEQRLARMESLMGQALERSRRWEGRGLLNDAYQELQTIQDILEDAPEVRSGPVGPPPPPPPPAYQPIADFRLQKILGSMSRESFAKDKLNVLQSATSSADTYLLVGQLQQLMNQFQFSKDRLTVVRMLWPRVLDRDNGFQLNSAFQFSNDKEELRRIISG